MQKFLRTTKTYSVKIISFTLGSKQILKEIAILDSTENSVEYYEFQPTDVVVKNVLGEIQQTITFNKI